MPVYRSLEMKSWSDLIFGVSKYPLRYGFNLEVGKGEVIPEIKYFPKRGSEKDSEILKREYREITESVLKRAVDLGLESIQLETEQTFIITRNPSLGGEITNMQKSIMEKFFEEFGLKSALRATVADIRELRGDMRGGEEISLILESFDKAAENGADVLSIESIGGKEVFNYSIIRQDIEGILFSVGILGSLDMEFLWREITRISRNHKIIAGGDTDCAHSNTAMVLAGGTRTSIISHTLAAVVRAIGAARSLVAFEQGAEGPSKDCGYENIIVKAITGRPISMEGKASAPAHSSLVGNVAAAACDLWSNEQIENIMLYGGSAPQVFVEILGYDVLLMNEALKSGFGSILRDLLVAANPLDPQVFVLSPEGAWRIGGAIVRYAEDYYLRSREAAQEALKIISDSYQRRGHNIPPLEARIIHKVQVSLNNMPDSYAIFVEKCISKYRAKVKDFLTKNYEL
ncbi:MAG: methanol--corrinoid methyltransferase [Candidatus Bathyarchaeota archaeon]|nr:methanol--corrinoid methyltransferase [Candidatus Bathyarchaeota archaeon]